MAYCNGTNTTTSTKSLTLIFDTEQLIYDIKNDAWVTGDVTQTEDPHDRHQVQDICEEGNRDHIHRILDMAYSELADLLFPFLKTDLCDGEVLDNTLRHKKKYVYELSVPDTFPRSSAVRLETLIHQYFVYRALQDRFTIVLPDTAPAWLERVTQVIDDIKRTASRRTERIHISLQPF
ncbi:MAG: hypothetical protein LUC22_01960 [Prevotella sp.]|nr:hypothetical protein [Prevotella sp.]